MRLAIVSDIHGNLEAFKKVLSDLDGQGVDWIVSLGDNVGYGPEPEAVVNLLRERGIPSVMGNHEWALCRPENFDWFNPLAQRALFRTGELMSREVLSYCCSLPRSYTWKGCRFVHGFPPEDLVTYLFQVDHETMQQALLGMAEETCFVGHTHELALVSLEAGHVEFRALGPGVVSLEDQGPRLINAGSVGQPRDGDSRAKYVIWDPQARTLEVRFVAYDVQKTAEGIAAAGIPQVYADRLW